MTAGRRPDRPIARFQFAAAHVAAATGALFAILLLSLHFVEPEYDPRWRFVSEYALGRFGFLMTTAFLALAVSLAAAVVGVWRHVRTTLGRVGLIVIVVAAAGLLIAALFRTDPITVAADAYSDAGRLHVLGASLDYSPIGMLLAGFGLSRTAGWRPLRRPVLAAATASTILMVAFVAALPRDGRFGPDVYAGLIGRLLLLSYVAWITIVAVAIIRRYRQALTAPVERTPAIEGPRAERPSATVAPR